MMDEFEYSNLIGRPAGRFVRIGSRFSPGIRKVQAQIEPYATAWSRSNLEALAADGPLWVVLGDSMSQGIGASAYDRGYVGQLAQELAARGKRYRIVNLSISGARVDDLINRQLPALESLMANGIKPDLVTVLIGSNDLVRKKYRERVLPLYTQMLARLPRGTVVANIPGRQKLANDIDALIDDAVERRGLVLADMQVQRMGGWKGKVAEDYFHPNEAGYATLAAIFARAIIGR